MQGPGKRPAVFSHDKLLWELCEDALEAARSQNGAPLLRVLQPWRPYCAAALLLQPMMQLTGVHHGEISVYFCFCSGALLQPASPAKVKHQSQPVAKWKIDADIDAVAIANYGGSLVSAGKAAGALPAKPRPLPAAAPKGKRVVHIVSGQLKQMAEQMEMVATSELKVLLGLRVLGVLGFMLSSQTLRAPLRGQALLNCVIQSFAIHGMSHSFWYLLCATIPQLACTSCRRGRACEPRAAGTQHGSARWRRAASAARCRTCLPSPALAGACKPLHQRTQSSAEYATNLEV